MKSGYIAIIGRPNAGKSTLLNRILETEISIVTPKAQTTRERVLGILTEPQGQIVFLDTPGIHRAKEGGINSYMMSEAKDALNSDDAALHCVWYVVDPKSALEFEQPVLELLRGVGVPVYLIMNKMDLKLPVTSEATLQRFIQEISDAMKKTEIQLQKVFRISALKDVSLAELLNTSWETLPEGPMYYPDPEQLSDRPVRFFVSEKIREQLLLQLGDEVPYSCAVKIEKFDEGLPVPRIEAIIFVERESQKGMVIGASGKKIKDIGSAARLQIEEFMGKKVFLGLQVRVLKDWSKEAESLKKLGYSMNEPKKPGSRSV